LPAPAIENLIYPMEPREFKLFRSLVHERTGIWLRDGKQVMLASRLSRRLRHHHMSGFEEYYRLIQNVPDDSEEIRELINCVTTNKTSFFREHHHFEYLANTVVPQAQAAVLRGAPRNMSVWSAASSTGEESYSVAITLLEALQMRNGSNTPVSQQNESTHAVSACPAGSWKIEIVASDIDTKVLDTGRRAIYNADSLVSVAPALQKKYFLRGKDDMRGQVKVKPDVTRLVQFKRINLMDARWPLVYNTVVIYFNHETQDVFLRKMVRHLKPRGYLFLGSSEHIPWLHQILEPLNKTMYRLRDVSR
jgi:chemotaxis protein methyltransferase CheR